MMAHGRLVVVSNRTPALPVAASEEERGARNVGGLVTAVRSALERRGGVWFGWSGRAAGSPPSNQPTTTTIGSIRLATLDLSRNEVDLSYNFFANRTLWPLLHNFPARVQVRHDAYRVYRRVNQKFAHALYWTVLEEGDLVWVHDYHLIPLGSELRRLGWTGKLGFFLHTPFPPAETFAILPWAPQFLENVLAYDLVGFHTNRYAHNLMDSLITQFGGAVVKNFYTRGQKRLRVEVHPIGIDPTAFRRWASAAGTAPAGPLPQIPANQQVVLGVDRLDYTKGIPRRLEVFENLLDRYPTLRGKVVMIQISAPSRSRLPEYIEEKERVDQLVGRINGRFAERGWLPVRYLYRSYTQEELASFYRQADLCLVTPLRDGMNLVAKEFVASQGEDPGVLMLSKFCGAADTMRDALIVNPYDIEETTAAIHRGLFMPLEERRRRWEALMVGVERYTAEAWSESFLADLVAT